MGQLEEANDIKTQAIVGKEMDDAFAANGLDRERGLGKAIEIAYDGPPDAQALAGHLLTEYDYEWSGDPNAVPALGLPAAVVKNVALFDLETQVRASFANWRHPTWGGGETKPDDFGEPPESYHEWSDLTDRTGMDTANTTNRRKRGRPPLADEHLAVVAYHYVQALRIGEGVHLYVQNKMQEGTETLPVAQWIKKAREQGFLTATPKPGQRGGDMTQETLDVLNRIGFPKEQDTGGTPQGGENK